MKKKLFFTLFNLFFTIVLVHAGLFINEVNSSGKWIEIYNDADTAVDMSGYTVTRYNNDYAENTATIPEGVTLSAKGFLVLHQDGVGSPVAGAIDCLPFGISTDKFWSAELKDKAGNSVDDTFNVGFPQMVVVTEGKSWAREADGAVDIAALEPTPGRSNTSPPLEESEYAIYVNEVNSTGKWIEIYNDETEAIDLGGYTIARYNNDNAIAQAPIPAGTTIAAKGFLVLYQGSAAPSPVAGAVDCLTFGISTDKFWYVVLKDDEGRIVDNTFNIGNPQTVTVSGGRSWARETDGCATILSLEPTAGKSNATEPEISPLKVFINEVNSTGKWIEIYNDEDVAVDLSGFTVSRNNNDGAIGTAIIPDGVIIPAKCFVVIYQGGVAHAPVDGAIDCLPYGISTEKFMNIVLKDAQGRLVDTTFDIGNPQTITVVDGESWARETDGAATIVAIAPNPGLKNDTPSGSEFVKDEKQIYVSGGTLIVPENTSHVYLYNIQGQLILNRKMTGSSVDLSFCPKGIYIVTVTVSGKYYTQKIVLSY